MTDTYLVKKRMIYGTRRFTETYTRGNQWIPTLSHTNSIPSLIRQLLSDSFQYYPLVYTSILQAVPWGQPSAGLFLNQSDTLTQQMAKERSILVQLS